MRYIQYVVAQNLQYTRSAARTALASAAERLPASHLAAERLSSQWLSLYRRRSLRGSAARRRIVVMARELRRRFLLVRRFQSWNRIRGHSGARARPSSPIGFDGHFPARRSFSEGRESTSLGRGYGFRARRLRAVPE